MIIGPSRSDNITVRIWKEDLPHHLSLDNPIKLNIPECSSDFGHTLQLAVEMKIDISPTHIYGLLGCNFQKAAGGLSVAIAVSDNKDCPFTDSIISQMDRVYWQLPRSFAEAINQAVVSHAGTLPCGSLMINCGASADIGSNNFIFDCLTHILLAALQREMPDEELVMFAIESGVDAMREVKARFKNRSHH
jgi:hypothetical protein